MKLPVRPITECKSEGRRINAVVAIPVCNEQDRIEACLSALADQASLGEASLGVLLFLNNCTDDTAQRVASFKAAAPFSIRVLFRDHVHASAGWARRIAMDAASAWLLECGSPDGVILTTDADTCVGPNWLATNLAYIAEGADAVAGRCVLNASEAALLPLSLHARGALEAEYETLLIEIRARLDPRVDPFPCHWTDSGASLAVRRRAYVYVGGMPDLPLGEDRAFVERLHDHGLRVRHPIDLEVVTSGRLDGRAQGGAADTMKLRCAEPESPCDDRLERLDRAVLRFVWQRSLRQAHVAGQFRHARFWAVILGMPLGKVRLLARLDTLTRSAAAFDKASPRLTYKPLPPSRLPGQIALAKKLRACLRDAGDDDECASPACDGGPGFAILTYGC